MKNWKTSITGLITATLSLLSYYGVIANEAQPYILAVGVALIGLFSQDGGSEEAK